MLKERKFIAYTCKCAVCGRANNRGLYCSRACELEQQRRSYGSGKYTIKQLLIMERGWIRREGR
jgi:hypothetical protein